MLLYMIGVELTGQKVEKRGERIGRAMAIRSYRSKKNIINFLTVKKKNILKNGLPIKD